MKKLMFTAVALAVSGIALAKLPPPDEAAKAKAAEAAAKTAWQGKVDAYKLCQVQDRVAAAYKKSAASRPAASAAPATAAAPAATATPAAATTAAAAAKPVPTTASASQGGSTPVATAAPAPAPCADPGPFAYAPPEQKPLETSGAHSPAANASSPPSVRPSAAEMTPSKPSVATKK